MSERTAVEILTFAACPNAAAARDLVTRVLSATQLDAEVREVEVEDADDALRLRFLGSPTIRADGNDIEPGAGERTQYVYACRVYRTASGTTGVPDEAWLRDALASATDSPTSPHAPDRA